MNPLVRSTRHKYVLISARPRRDLAGSQKQNYLMESHLRLRGFESIQRDNKLLKCIPNLCFAWSNSHEQNVSYRPVELHTVRGYFDLINSVDELILYDDMQYNRRAWRNRNLIKSSSGVIWLTIPVQVKGKYFQKIKDTVVVDGSWAREHWQSILHNYSKAKYFSD